MYENHNLNTEIAEHVMGWHTYEAWWIPIGADTLAYENLSNCRVIDIWHPDSNVKDAFEVVDKLADLGHVITIKADGKRSKERRYTIIGEAGRLGGDQASVCLAICEAALMIVGGYARS